MGFDDGGQSALDRAAELRRRWSIDVVVPQLEPAPVDLDLGPAPSAAPPVEHRVDVPLRVACLGGFTLDVAGQAVDLTSARPRARAALRMLAMHVGRSVHIETLIEALWPEGEPAAGKRNLQVAVSSLRRILDEHQAGAGALLVREGNAYMLALPDGAEADVVTFAEGRDACRAAAAIGDDAATVAAGERALAAYGGELLPEEGPAEWVVHQRRNLTLDAAEVASLVAEHAGSAGRWDTVVAACSRGLDIDRFNDALWRLLVAAHEQRGDPAAAAQAQQRYRLVLHDLGMQES
jgi:DNA-binding SARP family transcriptional activator